MVVLFQQGTDSFGKTRRELAEMMVWVCQQLLGSRGVPVHDELAAYDEDVPTLRRLGQLYTS